MHWASGSTEGPGAWRSREAATYSNVAILVIDERGENVMDFCAPGTGATAGSHLLRFTSLHDRGRGIAVPCDAVGNVDIDSLSLRLRLAYLGARAMVGRDYSLPTVQLAR